MPATCARTEYMMNNDTKVPVNRPETQETSRSGYMQTKDLGSESRRRSIRFSKMLLAYEEGDHMGVPGLLRLEVLHGHLPVVAGEVPQEDALDLVRELKHLLRILPHVNPFMASSSSSYR